MEQYSLSAALNGGRILLFDPSATLTDGAAEIASGGFFDVDNIPPWDTWVCFVYEATYRTSQSRGFDGYLVSWVPPYFIECVNAGIEVNPEQCIGWADEMDTEFTRMARSLGLL
jgi:hypothetical protein